MSSLTMEIWGSVALVSQELPVHQNRQLGESACGEKGVSKSALWCDCEKRWDFMLHQ